MSIQKPTNPKTQSDRVIAVCCDGKYRTLEGIQNEIKRRFNQYDSAPAISARLREGIKLYKSGYVKDKYHITNPVTKRPCYYYTLKGVY